MIGDACERSKSHPSVSEPTREVHDATKPRSSATHPLNRVSAHLQRARDLAVFGALDVHVFLHPRQNPPFRRVRRCSRATAIARSRQSPRSRSLEPRVIRTRADARVGGDRSRAGIQSIDPFLRARRATRASHAPARSASTAAASARAAAVLMFPRPSLSHATNSRGPRAIEVRAARRACAPSGTRDESGLVGQHIKTTGRARRVLRTRCRPCACEMTSSGRPRRARPPSRATGDAAPMRVSTRRLARRRSSRPSTRSRIFRR